MSPFHQLLAMRALPGFKSYLRRHSCLVAEGDITPTALSETYRVRIEYPQNKWPKVWVHSPKLVPREQDGDIPHMYEQDRICLWMPGSGEWTEGMSVAEAVIPWASEWLYYYELWHATGEWLGGGHEPGAKPFRNEGKRAHRDKRRR
jgi:hypothetical protein